METYLHPQQLQLTSEFFRNRLKNLHALIGDLTLEEVKSENALATTTKRIKSETLLIPVAIKEPKITDRQERRRSLSMGQVLQNASPVLQEVTVEFPFEGSEELFSCAPQGSFSGTRFYQPNGDCVQIQVTIGALDKNAALTEARRKMSDTIGLVNQVNVEAQAWSTQVEQQIPDLIAAQRKKLIDFYS